MSVLNVMAFLGQISPHALHPQQSTLFVIFIIIPVYFLVENLVEFLFLPIQQFSAFEEPVRVPDMSAVAEMEQGFVKSSIASADASEVTVPLRIMPASMQEIGMENSDVSDGADLR